MTKQTLITCPRCSHAVHTACIISNNEDDFNDANLALPGMHYMQLTCQHCNMQLQFVVDLAPSLNRQESACASIG
jgi:transcription elongation factor Elf1